MSNGNGQSIKCQCGGDLATVVDSRARLHKEFGQIISRRRKCSKCGERSTTFEVHEDTIEGIRRGAAKALLSKLLEGIL